MTQNEMILDYIKKNGSITNYEAFGLGCCRLSGRIHDLRALGYPIVMRRETKKNLNGKYKTYGVYTLEGVENEQI